MPFHFFDSQIAILHLFECRVYVVSGKEVWMFQVGRFLNIGLEILICFRNLAILHSD